MAAPDGGVVSVGSINVDVTLHVRKLVQTGETISAFESNVSPGGKSANQAAAAARLGASTALVAAVGTDSYGDMVCRELTNAGVNLDGVRWVDAVSTGSAYICVDDAGENTIVLDSGANGHLTADHLRPETFANAAVVTLCFEVDADVVATAASYAQRVGATVILNLSPARDLPQTLAALTDILVMNELEFQEVTGETSVSDDALARALAALSVRTIVVTLGAAGAVAATEDTEKGITTIRIPGTPTRVVDTTGCGDAFLGALASGLAAHTNLEAALILATQVGAYSATRFGAQPSYPTREELDAWVMSLDVSV